MSAIVPSVLFWDDLRILGVFILLFGFVYVALYVKIVRFWRRAGSCPGVVPRTQTVPRTGCAWRRAKPTAWRGPCKAEARQSGEVAPARPGAAPRHAPTARRTADVGPGDADRGSFQAMQRSASGA